MFHVDFRICGILSNLHITYEEKTSNNVNNVNNRNIHVYYV